MNRQQRQELLKQLDRRVAMIGHDAIQFGAPNDPLLALAATAIRDLQEKLDNAHEASVERENWQ